MDIYRIKKYVNRSKGTDYPRRSIFRLSVMFPLLVILPAVLIGASVTFAQLEDSNTDYCEVDDFVDNQYLVRADDALLLEIQFDGSNSLEINLWPLQNSTTPYGTQGQQDFSYSNIKLIDTQCGSGFINYLTALPSWSTRYILPVQTRLVRLFDLPYDVVTTLAPSANARGDWCDGVANSNDSPMNIYIQRLNGQDLTTLATVPVDINPMKMQMAAADFNSDGFEDLFVVNESGIWIFTATDSSDPSKGVSEATSLTLPADVPGGRNAPRIGDLDDDGNLDVVWVSGGTQPTGGSSPNDITPTVVFATICSGLNSANGCAQNDAFAIKLRTERISLVPFPADNSPPFSPSAATLVGEFDLSNAGDELVVVQVQPSGSEPARTCVLDVYTLNAGLTTATQLGTKNVCDELDLKLNGQNGFVSSIYADNGAFNFYDTLEQVAVGLEECYGQPNDQKGDCFDGLNESHLTVITFDEGNGFQINVTQQQTWQSNMWLGGVKFGRYGDTSDINSNSTAADFQLQLAVQAGHYFGIFQAQDPLSGNFTLDDGVYGWWPLPYGQTTSYSGFASNSTGGSAIFAGDLQGRSFRLGPPTVVRVAGHSQPTVILGVPPMHVDALDLKGASDSPRIVEPVNFSVFPAGYNTQYNFDTTSTTTSSTQSTTSWTKSTKEAGGASYGFAGFKASNQETFQQSWSNTSTSKNYSSQKAADTVTDQTETADKVLFRSKVFNLYTYPLIGQTDCPASNPDCTAAEEQPAYVTFSGENVAASEATFVPGTQIEWYHPGTQPGNLFSYPPNQRLLEDRLPGGSSQNSPLRTTDAFTTSGGSSRTLSLTSTNGSSQTTGTTSNHSFDSKTSVSAAAYGVNVSGSFEYSSSTSLSTLNSSTSSLQAATGIDINAQGPFLAQSLELYDYNVNPYLYGSFSAAPQTLSPDAQVKTTGALRTLYTADPTNAGSWWLTTQSDYSNFPDVALNHPTQWCLGSQTDCGATNSPTENQCISQGEVATCGFFQAADSEPEVWNNDFYNMKGLFVLDSTANSVASVMADGPASPQLSEAVEGDIVILAAQIYNYSFVDMQDANVDMVKVQFYYQDINPTNHSLDSAGATLIDEAEIDPIGPFCGAASANCDPNTAPANFAYAATSFNTSGLADKSVVFWVVAWMADSSGMLVEEVPSHGLTAVPALPSTPVDITQLGTEMYSNNIGLFRYVFNIIAEPSDPCAQGAVPTFTELTLSPKHPLPGDKVRVSAKLISEDIDRHYVEVFFTDRRYSKHRHDYEFSGEKVFDYELLSRVRVAEEAEALVAFRPTECGFHEILAQAGEEVISEWLYVSCDGYRPDRWHGKKGWDKHFYQRHWPEKPGRHKRY